MNQISYEAAFTHFDSKYADGNGLSLAGSYGMSNQLDAGGRFDVVHLDGEDSYRLGGTVGYEITPGFQATGELGFFDPA